MKSGFTTMLRLLTALLFTLTIAGVSEAAPGDAAPSGRVAKPVLEAGKGDKCVEDTQFMRRNHMKLLMHQRDDTVHQGVRTKQHSLKGCIECHASSRNNSVIGSNENFCQGCHAYAGVTLDCFDCHTSKPGTAPPAASPHGQPLASASSTLDVKPVSKP
jgi:hypothetical protein